MGLFALFLEVVEVEVQASDLFRIVSRRRREIALQFGDALRGQQRFEPM